MYKQKTQISDSWDDKQSSVHIREQGITTGLQTEHMFIVSNLQPQ